MTNSEHPESVEQVLSSLVDVSDEPGAVLAPQTQAPLGPPEGFGRGVNEYLNHYVGVADAKAAGFLAAALTVGATVITLEPTSVWGLGFYWLSILLLSGAGTTSAMAIIPRLPRAVSRGLIFWEQIRGWKDAAEYQRALSQTTAQDVEFEYAAQNHVVSSVLHAKHALVRWSIYLFLSGAASAVMTYLSIRYA